MATVISGSLSVAGIRSIQKQLKQYKKRLIEKCQVFVEQLALRGIAVGEANLGQFEKFITFSVETEQHGDGVKAIMYATNSGIIHSQWLNLDENGNTIVREEDVSPILMAEFGSGLRANNVTARKFGMGTGTFPHQTHAEDPEGWWYMTLDGEWHHSYGVTPTMPMAKAQIEMLDQIDTVAKEVFGS